MAKSYQESAKRRGVEMSDEGAKERGRSRLEQLDEQLARLREDMAPTIEYYLGFLDEGEVSQNSALAMWASQMKHARTVKAFTAAQKEFLKVGGAYVERHEVKSVGLTGELGSDGEDVVARLLEGRGGNGLPSGAHRGRGLPSGGEASHDGGEGVEGDRGEEEREG